MRILLVRTARLKQAITLGEFMFSEPLGLECVFGVLKDRHTLRILDLMVDDVAIEEVCAGWRPDAVGITSLCVDVTNVIELAARVKAHDPGITTLAGGTQAFMAPGSFEHPAVDHIFEFTTQANLTAFFDALEAGGEVPVLDGVRSRARGFASNGVKGFNEYLVPDRASTEAYRAHYSYFGYRPCAIMQTSQGCARHCGFCLRWRLEGGAVKAQPLDGVMDQIRSIAEPSITIFDNDLLHDGARLDALCERLEREGIRKHFVCYGSVRAVLANKDAVARFARNGLRAVMIGYESFSSSDMAEYRKASTPDDNLAAAAFLRSIDVDAWASFILHPDWDREDFRRFRRYLRALRPQVASMSPLTPLVPVPFFEPYEDRLLYPRDDYEMWSFSQVTIRPSRMSLRRYYYEVLKTNLYINLWSNNLGYLVRKFGPGTFLRLLRGALRVSTRYVRLMREASPVIDPAPAAPPSGRR
jgi:radical SAM superfamily enzyme YgiQ (UPF0313 family)